MLETCRDHEPADGDHGGLLFELCKAKNGNSQFVYANYCGWGSLHTQPSSFTVPVYTCTCFNTQIYRIYLSTRLL